MQGLPYSRPTQTVAGGAYTSVISVDLTSEQGYDTLAITLTTNVAAEIEVMKGRSSDASLSLPHGPFIQTHAAGTAEYYIPVNSSCLKHEIKVKNTTGGSGQITVDVSAERRS